MLGFLVFSLGNLLFAALLVAGAHKSCHKLVLSWVVAEGTFLCKSLINNFHIFANQILKINRFAQVLLLSDILPPASIF